mmetsp:Transcript_15948/g.49340  ORF Transcript_15948/g.49340 Transcript_15948/m.49340 type:complete len:428 (-) Transcript_15948:389-1672(-)
MTLTIDGKPVEIDGVLRSTDCLRSSTIGFTHFNCEHCRNLPHNEGLRSRIRRNAAKDTDEPSSSTVTIANMGEQQLVAYTKKLQIAHRQDRLNRLKMLHQLASLTKRKLALHEKVYQAAARGDIIAIAKDLNEAHATGKLVGKEATVNFIRDLVHALLLGSNSKNMRWSADSSRIMQILNKLGGPRTMRFFRATLAGMHQRTIERHWAKNRIEYRLGLDEDMIRELAELYKNMCSNLGTRLPLIAQLATDETGVKAEFAYSPTQYSLLGGCGTKQAEECVETLEACRHRIADENPYGAMLPYFDKQRLATYLSLTMINPLHVRVPALPCLILPTDNRFNTEDVKRQHEALTKLVKRHFFKGIFDFIGTASDGDPKRVNHQLSDMTSSSGERFKCVAGCFTLSGLIIDGVVTGVHAQCGLHCGKKFAL